MSDVLIKNIEMPKSNERVFLSLTKEGLSEWDENKLEYVKDYNLVELPPHGDLKDYDFIGNKMSNTYEKNKDKWNPSFADGFVYALKMLDKAPTVLEASK